MSEVKPQNRRPQRRDSTRALKAEETRQMLVRTATGLFAERGYHGVGIRDITATAGVTRGAFSHHFADKLSLFTAVFEQVEQGLLRPQDSDSASLPDQNTWARLRHRIQKYMDAATDPVVQRITLIDAPAVLGWRQWRALEERYGLKGLELALEVAMAENIIRTAPVLPLAHLLLGSITEAAMMIANAQNPELARIDVGRALDEMLKGLQVPSDFSPACHLRADGQGA